jgi:alkanesulfonate monooxygenase
MGQVIQAAKAAEEPPPRFSLSTRPILAETNDKAWDRAHDILRRIRELRGGAPPPKPDNLGSQRLLAAAAKSEVHDSCLWTKLAEMTGARGNSTALVGDPETVAKALLAYYKIGASSLLIRGYEPLRDAEQYGAELIPIVRKMVAREDAAAPG